MLCCYSFIVYILLLPFLLITMPMTYMDKMMWEEAAIRGAWTAVFGLILKALMKMVWPACDKCSMAMKMAWMAVVFFAAGLFTHVWVEKVWWQAQRELEMKEKLGARIPVA